MWLDAKKALEYAQASQRIEGLQMSPYAVEVAERMLAGEITYEQARELLIEAAKLRSGSNRKSE